MIPRPFQSLRALRILNVGGVGLALAAVTSLVFAFIVNEGRLGLSALVTGLPTLVIGTLWARLLRWRQTVGTTRLRVAWLLSIPLAMLNAGLAAAIMVGGSSGRIDGLISGLLGGFLLGATFGAMVWVPALVLTLLAFGVPIAWAQRQAEKGLAGEERGEWVIGSTVALLSAASLLGVLLNYGKLTNLSQWVAAWQHSLASVGVVIQVALGALGLVAGASSTALALAREARRRSFVRDAEEGKMAGFRVDPTPEGKVLVRVTAAEKEDYRVADFDEELYELDAQGNATQPVGREQAGRWVANALTPPGGSALTPPEGK